ncbi:hypothetical protein DEI99_007075 [Curtobacterium sp. MCLR17_036]|nr:hypothetical protein [Curtobacterium sp. MCLR17_036]WIE66289.1 hypothetical protein DEI99_007075 [Curtobacterium sp. MCLR17_036]
MAPQNDELSSHRTRTNLRPEQGQTPTGSTAVLDDPDAQQTTDR